MKRFIYPRILCLLFFAMLFVGQEVAYASTRQTVQQQSLQSIHQQLEVDRERNLSANNKLDELNKLKANKWDKITAQSLLSEEVENKQLALAVAKADLVNAHQVWMDVQQQIHDIQDRINRLEDSLQEVRVSGNHAGAATIEKMQAELSFLISYRDILNKRLSTLDLYKSTTEKIVQIEQEVYSSLTSIYHQKQNIIREKQLVHLSAEIQTQRAEILEKLQNYNQTLQNISFADRDRTSIGVITNMQIFEAEEQLYLADLKLSLARINDEIADISALNTAQLYIPELDEQLRKLTLINTKLDNIDRRISAKTQLIDSKRAILRQSLIQQVIAKVDFESLDGKLADLLINYQNKSELTEKYRHEITTDKEIYQTALTKSISKRQVLTNWNWQSWKSLGYKFIHLPSAFYSACVTLSEHLGLVMNTVTANTLYLLIISEFLIVLFSVHIRRIANVWHSRLKDKSPKTTNHLLMAVVSLLQHNLLALTVTFMSLSFFWFMSVPFKLYRFLAYLLLVWFISRFLINLARFFLLENIQHVDGEDVKLYYRLKWAVVVGGTITAMTVLAHQLSIAYEVRDLFNRLFMLFLLGFSLTLFWNRKIIPQLLKPLVSASRPYVRKALDLFFTLLPITLFSNAIIGLVGYVQLAWLMGYHQVMILMILMGFIIFRGVLTDIMEELADYFIRNLQNGWLWTQAFLKPIDKIMRLIIFVGAIVVLFVSFGWDYESPVVKYLSFIIHYEFLSFTGGQISILSLIEFTIAAAIFFWVGRWSREFAYRWVYKGIEDIGIRNSLSIFTQYFLVAVGTVVTLHILGLDFGGLSYVLGGLAVGLGFGLRDFANNIISGIMILIERPVREGDLITVGEYEGKVEHIGIRSMMVKSWDHMEVMIPNAETLNKSFTNWTHQDSIVRTVIPVKIHRDDDPVLVQSLLMNLLLTHPLVLRDPEPQVFMSKIDDVLIEFEVRYFMNVLLHPRVEVKSIVLFEIHRVFKESGIRPPYPQQAVELIK